MNSITMTELRRKAGRQQATTTANRTAPADESYAARERLAELVSPGALAKLDEIHEQTGRSPFQAALEIHEEVMAEKGDEIGEQIEAERRKARAEATGQADEDRLAKKLAARMFGNQEVS